MSTQNVYDGNGRRAGYYNEMSNVIYAHDASGRNVGYYNKNTDTTFDRNGRRYGNGNLVTSLIMESNQNSR
jgi:hypothetical protein